MADGNGNAILPEVRSAVIRGRDREKKTRSPLSRERRQTGLGYRTRLIFVVMVAR